MTKADIGVVGLGVMGRNLALNIHDHGFEVVVYNRTVEKIEEFLQGEAIDTKIVGAYSLEELVGMLEPPRRLLLMVSAGDAVDSVIEQLRPLLAPGDIIIDGGNSQFTETMRRSEELEKHSLSFIGTGISGGEEGARHGPSIMPGGTAAAWEHVQPILQGIAAKATDGAPCCEWLGANGAGHYVKMVHNGIEYADMQLIAEAYDLMKRSGGIPTEELHAIFGTWNEGRLGSFLLEITADIMTVRENGAYLVDKIRGVAEQKGTGKWTVISSMHTGIPATTISEAVFARILSAFPDDRAEAARLYETPGESSGAGRKELLSDLEDALYAAKIVAYAQGFHLLAAASEEYGWGLDLQSVARIWRAGCIIRSRLLEDIVEAFGGEGRPATLMLAPGLAAEIGAAEAGWRRTVVRGIEAGVPVPALASALTYFDGLRSKELPANLVQAQRDYFGSHTYERSDRPAGEYFHTEWSSTRKSSRV